MMNTTRRKRPPRKSGLTLVDMVISVMIMGILAAVATPRFANAMTEYRIQAAAQRIAADIRYARQQAIAKSSDTSIQFMTLPNYYEISGVANPDRRNGNYIVNQSDIDSDISSLVANFDGTALLTFNHHGVPQTGSPLTNLSAGTITITMGNLQRTITVAPTTGRLTIS